MNVLNGRCLSLYGRCNFWTTPCCKVALNPKATAVLNGGVDQEKLMRNKELSRTKIKSCPRYFPVVPTQYLWTQVRFNKGCPPHRFHNDIDFPNFDAYRKDDYTDVRKTAWGAGDGKSGMTYVVGFLGFLCGSYGLKTVAYDLVTFMSAPADVLALATIEVDISKVAPGGCLSYKWRGKPLFIKNRTDADIELEAKTPMAALRDPQTTEDRCTRPEWLVVIGVCTHLGCVPIPNSGDWSGGFYCPCHGSHYDNVGRARKGPAPLNLEIPPYKFVSDTVILVG